MLLWPTNLGGCTTLTIVSGHSMEPTYYTGDLVLSRCGTPEVGDIVVYRPAELDGPRIIHRIIGGDGEAGWDIQGDNNPVMDPFNPVNDEVLGIAALRIPSVGRAVTGLSDPYIWLSLCVLALALVAWPNRPDADEDAADDDVLTVEGVQPVGHPQPDEVGALRGSVPGDGS